MTIVATVNALNHLDLKLGFLKVKEGSKQLNLKVDKLLIAAK